MRVQIDPDHPDAIPVVPGSLQRSFTRRRDQWIADVDNANGRLARGTLDLPPRESVQAAFVMGADGLRHAMGTEALSADQAWPFIAASHKQQGSDGPYWFLVRAVEHELDALQARLERALDVIGWRTGALRRDELLGGMEAIRRGTALAPEHPLAVELTAALPQIERTRRELVDNLARADEIERPIPAQFAELIAAIADGRRAAGEALEALAAGEVSTDGASQNYWARVHCRAAAEYGERVGLHAVLRREALSGAHSNARKALRHLDAATFGPRIERVEAKEAATAAAQ